MTRRKKKESTDKKSFYVTECSICGNEIKVSKEATGGTCWRCLAKRVPPPPEKKEYKPTGRPRGWKLYKEFVDKDGNVFHFGKEQPDLKGTLPPTEVEVKKKSKTKKSKKTKKEKEEAKLKEELKRRAKAGKAGFKYGV